MRVSLSVGFAFLALSGLLISGGRAQTATTDPVGFHTITINPGLRTVGLPLVRPAVGAGLVASSTAAVVTGSSAAVNYGSQLTATTAYYLEVTAGTANAYIGDRWDVDVAATIASSNSTVTLSTASPNNTTPGNLPDLTGYSFVIRPHLTIGYVFGTKGNTPMFGSPNSSRADQVQFFNPVNGLFEGYYLLRSPTGSTEEWRKLGDITSANYDALVIPPGVGMFVKRNGTTDVFLTMTGEVRTTAFFAQNLKVGLNLISEGYPVSASPLSRDCTTLNGFAGSPNSTRADQIQIWNSALGSYDAYYLLKPPTGAEHWRKAGDISNANFETSNLFGLDGAVFIKKVAAQVDYSAPKGF